MGSWRQTITRGGAQSALEYKILSKTANLHGNGLNTKFWSLPVHLYQKQSFLMINLAVRGQGKNLVIDQNFIVKK